MTGGVQDDGTRAGWRRRRHGVEGEFALTRHPARSEAQSQDPPPPWRPAPRAPHGPCARAQDDTPVASAYSPTPSIRRARTRLPFTSPEFSLDKALSAMERSTAT